MAYDPYEEEFTEEDNEILQETENQLMEMGGDIDLPLDNPTEELVTTEEPSIEDLSGMIDETEQPEEQPSSDEYHSSGKIKGVANLDFIRNQWKERKVWQDLPEGEEKDAARRAWNTKYYGEEDPNILDRFATGVKRSDPGGVAAFGGYAPALGLIDTGTDTLNLIPGVDIPKVGEFESNALQATRNISGLILPMRILKGFIGAKAISTHKAGVAPAAVKRLGNNRLFQWIADQGLDLGTGVAVDYVSKQNQEDHNLAGQFKKWAPKTFQFIPNSIATLDSDSADLKRAKNVKEGALLGFWTSVLSGVTQLTKAGGSVKRASSKFIPENELAKANLNKLTTDEFTDIKFDENPIIDNVLRAEARAQKELDNLGRYHLKTDPEFTEAKVGRDDVFDANETSVRAVDPDGVAGAAVDNARILNNIESTYGRLGNILSEPALKMGLDPTNLSNRSLVKAVARELKNAGHFSKQLPSGVKISNETIDKAGVRLAEILNDPRMQPGEMKLLLDEFRDSVDGVSSVSAKGLSSLKQSIQTLKSNLLDMDVEKAKAYLLSSQAGQVSDIAEGARLMDGTTAVRRAQDQIIDKLEYLLVEGGITKYQSSARRNYLQTWNQAKATGDPNIMEEAVNSINQDVNGKLMKIIPEAENFANTLREITDKYPEFLRPFLLANEMTDGNIDSMFKLNTYVQNKLGTFSKAFYDGTPEIPSIINRTQMSIVFNSILSAFSTPIRALYGNVGGLIGKPTSIFAGALMKGDGKVLRRSFHQYAGFVDSFMKSFDHMKVVYRKAATDPTSMGYIMRDDIAIKEVQELDMLKQWAKASEANGEDGASVLINIFEQQDALARHPWLRFCANSMSALDGFNRSMYAVAEAKGRAFDAIQEAGQDMNPETLKQASDEIYNTFFDSNGMITDDAVDFATRESALNLDSELVKGLNQALKRVPILRSIFMFPRTQMNNLDLFRKWSPLDASHIGHQFEGDFAKFHKYSWENYPVEELEQLLNSKGIPLDANAEINFKTKQAEYQGRVAIGSTMLLGGALLATQDRIRGNGHWDTQVQRTRRDLKWQPKTYQGWDGKWYSYEWLGPLGDVLSAGVDLTDNFDSMSTATFEKMEKKLSFIVGASLTNKSLLQTLEPVQDILAGNPAAGARWISQFTNAMLPLAGMRADLTRLMAPMKREYDNDVNQLIRNRNGFIDIIDPDGSLPYKYNFVTGAQIGRPSSWWARVNNSINVWKVHDDVSEEEQFLLDIEFDSRPFFNKSKGGIEYTNHQRAELYSKVGEQGYFRDELKKIKKIAENMSYTDSLGNTYKGYKNIIQALRRGGITESELDASQYGQIMPLLNKAIIQSTRLAGAELNGRGIFTNIPAEEAYMNIKRNSERQGDVEATLEINKQIQQLQNKVQSR